MIVCEEAVTDGWVKCEDRLPEEWENVLVYYEYKAGEKIYGIYDVLSGNTIKISKEKGKRINVIAWRPFPNYEGEIQPEEELPFK